MAKTDLCASCVNAVRCYTWGEWKCLKQAVRFSSYGHSMPTKCSDYEKRGKDFKESRCQCDDCLRNESLAEELDEESEV